ncbi:MAG: tetratricopeptide repeat protein [Pirellulales bacterium]|nr:tetratricopeptide repeat protein [Pirellulales bacterium]
MRFCRLAVMASVVLAPAWLLAPTQLVAQEKTPEATRQYNAAVGLHNSEAYDLAADEWLKFLTSYKTDPRAAHARHYLGICYSKQNKHEEALKAFQTVVKDFPKFDLLADTYLNLALTQYQLAHSGKPELYDVAAETFRTLATKYPQSKHVADAIFYEGECLYNRGKKQEAAAKYDQVVKDHADRAVAAQAMFALGVTQADLQQHETALATYDAFLKQFPESPLVAEAKMWRGETLFALKRYDDAIAAYAASAAVEGFAMADYATVRQADALAAKQQFAEAAGLYASVPAKFPTSQYAGLCHLEAGKKYYAADDHPKAQEWLGKVVAAGGAAAPEAAHWIARSLLKQKKPAEALAVVERILPAAGDGPDAVSLWMDQADAIYEIPERRGEAVALYAALAAKHADDPLAPQALYMAAFAAMNQGEYQTALTHAGAFLKAHPGNDLAVGVKHIMAESNLLLNNHAEAEKLYGQLLAEAPNDRDAEIWKVHLGTAMYLQKKYEQTVAALEPVVDQLQTPGLVAEAWYRIGRSQVALKQYGEAAKSLEASLAAEPKWKLADDARLVLAYAYQQTKNLDKAKENARKVIEEFPDSGQLDMAHYRLGECHRLGNELPQAMAEYQLVLKTWPESPLANQTLFGLGWAQLGAEDYAAAEQTFTTLVEKHPDDTLIPRARYGRGMARQRLEKYQPAAEDLQALLSADPSQAEKSRARHILGLCQKGLQQFDQEAATLQTLLKEDPDYAGAANVYFELGWAQKSLKQEAEAAATFALLTEKYPDSPLAADSHYLVGDFANERKDYKKAAVAYYAAMKQAGKTDLGEEAAYKLGLAYFLQDDLKNALQTFQYQQATWPEGPLASDGAFMEGECLSKQDQPKEALAAYQRVTNPSNKETTALALLHAGQAAGQLKQWQKCLELATQCAEKAPDSPSLHMALYQQGWAQQNLGKPDEAMKLYPQVIAKANDEWAARAQFMIGEIQFEQKNHAEAIKSFYKVIYGYGYPQWQADATYEAARCFEVRREPDKAVQLYRMLIEKYADSDKVSLAKQRIEQLKQ